jgi:hypothetical protein
MPVNEFEGNESWGYNPSFFFAPDKYYGHKDKLKELIDVAHQNGMAVIIDMVLNHAFGQNVMARMYWDEANNRPSADNPWFNPVAPNTCFLLGQRLQPREQIHQGVHRPGKLVLAHRVQGGRLPLRLHQRVYQQRRQELRLRLRPAAGGHPQPHGRNHLDGEPDAYVILEHLTDKSEEDKLAEAGMLLWRPRGPRLQGSDRRLAAEPFV